MNKRVLLVVFCGLGLWLSACAGQPFGDASDPDRPAAARSASSSTRTAAQDIELAAGNLADQGTAPSSTIYRGTGVFFDRAVLARRPVEVDTAGGLTLNFVDADLREVLKAVLDDILGLNFTMDPGISGSITLQSSRPIPRGDVLATLETALAINGLALIETADGYQILPLANATERAGLSFVDGPPDSRRAGFGIEIVPLEFASAPQMRDILQPFAPTKGIFRVDAARNILFIAGTSRERAAMVDIIRLFDVDWLKSMSFAIHALEFVEAQTLIAELQEIIAGPESPLVGLVRLIPLPRINAVLAISARPNVLDSVAVWIKRLDITRQASGRRIFIYHVQNSKAEDLAGSLSNIMGGGSVPAPARPAQIGAGTAPGAPGAANATGINSGGLGSGAFNVIADEKSNALLIYATPGEYELVKAALQQLDTAPHQVLIEAAIVEVTLNDDLQYGVQWFFQSGNSNVGFSDGGSSTAVAQFPGFSFTRITTSIQTAINTIASVTDVKVVSSPKILVLNNQTATLQVGDQVPVAIQSAVSISDPGAPIVNTVQFRDTGVILTVTPRINNSGLVIIEIAQEVSDVATTTTSGIDSPTIQQRKINTTVAVHDGETIALGGLIRETESRGNSGVPFLKDIPLLGAIFRSTNNATRRTELLIFLTPRIIRSLQDARDTTQYLRDQLRNLDIEDLLGE